MMTKLLNILAEHGVLAIEDAGRILAVQEYMCGAWEVVEIEPTVSAVRLFLGY